MKWEVTGVWKTDGSNGSLIVEAPNQRGAEIEAAQRGLMVEQAIPAGMHSPYSAPPQMPQQIVHVIHREQGVSPGIAALLSFLIPGLGQMASGQVGIGILWLVGVLAGYFMCFVPGLVLHIVCIVSAATVRRT